MSAPVKPARGSRVRQQKQNCSSSSLEMPRRCAVGSTKQTTPSVRIQSFKTSFNVDFFKVPEFIKKKLFVLPLELALIASHCAMHGTRTKKKQASKDHVRVTDASVSTLWSTLKLAGADAGVLARPGSFFQKKVKQKGFVPMVPTPGPSTFNLARPPKHCKSHRKRNNKPFHMHAKIAGAGSLTKYTYCWRYV